MEKYKNSGGDSGVSGYEIGPDFINVKFSSGKTYTYSRKAGKKHVDQMKILAQRGNGLNSYINMHVKHLYD